MEPEGAEDDAAFVSLDTEFLSEDLADGDNLQPSLPTSPAAVEKSLFQQDSGSALFEENGTDTFNLDGVAFTPPVEDDARVQEVDEVATSRDGDETGHVDSVFLPDALETDNPMSPTSNGPANPATESPLQLPSESSIRVNKHEDGSSKMFALDDADVAMPHEPNASTYSERAGTGHNHAERDYSPSQIDSTKDMGAATEEIGGAAHREEKSSSVVLDQVLRDDNQLPAVMSAPSSTLRNDILLQQQTSSVPDGEIGSTPGAPLLNEPTLDGTDEREPDGRMTSLEATGLRDVEPDASPNVDGANGGKGHSGLCAQGETGEENEVKEHELQPAKRTKTSKIAYTGADAVSLLLGQTAETILVLAGMSQMRAGRPSTEYEKELASSACSNLEVLVSRVAPRSLVAKEYLDSMEQDFNAKRVAQKKREEQAWIDAVTEAESLANARALAKAKAEAEAAAAAAAVAAAAAAKAQAEAEELERRRQASLQATLGANGSSNSNAAISTGEAPSSSGHPVYMQPPPSTLVAGQHSVLPNQMNSSKQQVSVSSSGEVPRSATPVKVTSVNGQFPAPPPSKGHPGRPPKARHRARKEQGAASFSSPDYLSQVQSQATDSQKAQMTHKQLSSGVQQYIREHVPPVSQTQQALQPTYISTPFPCQVCKVIAEDTNSVLVCDSCDQVTHVKCVQPTPPKSAAKNDWNCRACLSASRGNKYPANYGLVRRGSPNSVKLWPPHDTSHSNSRAAAAVSNGSLNSLLSTMHTRKGANNSSQSGQKKSNLEIDTRRQDSSHEGTGGTLGNSPHLVVHLVNEPSPKPNALPNSTNALRGHRKRSAYSAPGSKSSAGLNTEDRPQAAGGSLMETSISTSEAQLESADEVDDNQTLSTIAKEGRERDQMGNVPAVADKSRKGTQADEDNEKTTRLGSNVAGKQGDIPLPIMMEWVGGSFRRADGKIYYRSCKVGGVTFSITDCALFRPETADVPPYIARLQVLWEDVETCHKWVRVSWCYYPSDIPALMGRPGPTVPDEVYESNHCDNNLLGSIQGPCYVLPPMKFREEKERRNALSNGNIENLPPIFLSRYMYDAPKGIFRPLQE